MHFTDEMLVYALQKWMLLDALQLEWRARLVLLLLSKKDRASDHALKLLKLRHQLLLAPYCLLQLILHHRIPILLLVLLGVVDLEVEEQLVLPDLVDPMAEASRLLNQIVLPALTLIPGDPLKEFNPHGLMQTLIPVQLNGGGIVASCI